MSVRGDYSKGKWDHTVNQPALDHGGTWDVIPEHAQPQVMAALTRAYEKHTLGDESIGWDELSDEIGNVLAEVMGDDAFFSWLECKNKRSGDE